jgi:hypothetical protein
MTSSGMLRSVALVRTDVTRIGELGTTLAVTSFLRSVESVASYS